VTKVTGTLHGGCVRLCQYFTEFVENEDCVGLKLYRTSQNTFLLNNFCYENRTVYEITWKDMVEPDRPQMTI